ncbi:BatB [Rhodopirellula sallentina SM41]|uniref:BatB n=2 Tax=Rhodopirellula TaxID=265488 RepID=M5U6D5_9BACT|nr:BatB [Rhodopirellula sallentina SM41]
MATIYDRYIAGMQATEFETAKVDTYAARFQWFALPAFVLLLIDYVVRLFARRSPRGIGRSASVAGMLLVFCLTATPAPAQTIEPRADLETDPTESTLEPTSVYNRGVELYREGEFSAAVDAFAQAVGAGSDEVAASARYNLGTSCYAAAIETLATSQVPPTQDASHPNDTADANDVNSVSATEQAKQILQQGIGALRSALRLRPDWEDARANLEKSVQLLAVIQESEQQQQEKSGQQENSEQSESQESSDSQEQDAGDEDSQQQSSNQDNSGQQQPEQSNSDSENPDSDNPDSNNSEQQDTSDEQSEDSNSEKGQESQNSEGDQPSEDGSQQQPNESDEQNDANSPSDSQASTPPSNEQDSNQQMSGDTGDPEEQSDPAEPDEQGEAEQETTTQDVSGSLSSDNQDESSQAPGANSLHAGEGKPDDRPMTAEEAMKMLQAIRDRDLIRRFRLQQLQQQRQIPVEKDW